jgi:hypothetical protein
MQSWYESVVPLDRQAHAEVSLPPGPDLALAAGEAVLPLGLEEIPLAAGAYPVVFRLGETVVPLAVLGLEAGRNLFVHEGGWAEGAYIPAVVRTFPFVLIEAGEGREVLGVEAQALKPAEHGERLFADGELTEFGRRRAQLAKAYRQEVLRAAELGAALRDAGLLVPRQADVNLAGGAHRRVDGFHVVDPARFAELPDETFLAWRKQGWLPAIYQHLASAARWVGLILRASAQAPAAQTKASEPPAAEASPAPQASPSHPEGASA